MATTASGVTIPGSSPTTTAATPIQDHWNNLGKSLNGRVVVPVASVTARAALVAALATDGFTPTTATPLYTHRADATVGSELEVTVNGTSWRTIGVHDLAVTASNTAGPVPYGAGPTVVLTAPAVTGDGVKKFKTTFSYCGIASSVPGDVFDIQFTCNGTIKGAFTSPVLNGSYIDGRSMTIFDVPAAGSAVYAVCAARKSGSGALAFYSAADTPLQLIVEQIA